MQNELDLNNFDKYFFHGMENKDQVVKWIIMNITKKLKGTHKELDEDDEKSRYELDKEEILRLIVQLERFTTLHDDHKKRQYFYDTINIESEEISEIFERNAKDIEKHFAISLVKDRPVSGIFFNTYTYSEEIKKQYQKYSGEEYLDILRMNSETDWGEEVYNILCYLEDLEKKNTYEYYSLFLDTKYARTIDSEQNGNNSYDKICEIRKVYRKFLKRNTCIRS